VSDSDSLEEDWAELRPKVEAPVLQTVHGFLETKVIEAIASALVTFRKDLKEVTQGEQERATYLERRLGQLIVDRLLNSLRTSNGLNYLIVSVLEAQGLRAEELVGFMHALPRAIIDNILLELPTGTAKGFHALISIEALRRDRRIDEYVLAYETDGQLSVTVWPMEGEREGEMTFRLDETFSLNGL
jgi:hypothetical protein